MFSVVSVFCGSHTLHSARDRHSYSSETLKYLTVTKILTVLGRPPVATEPAIAPAELSSGRDDVTPDQ